MSTVWRVLLLLLWSGSASAGLWAVEPAASRLGFVGTWEDTPFEGVFHRFRADIDFDPEALGSSRFDVRVEVGSADTQSSDRDAELVGPNWFSARAHPEAHFLATSFRSDGPGRYVAQGTLTLKGVSRPLALPFAWRAQGKGAVLDTEVVLRRTDFRVGEGEWASGETIGIDVRVVAHLTLRPAKGQPE
jgi:polyisoprenoid-binding protein YceI